MEKDLIAYHNGEWMPSSKVVVNPRDKGFQRGDSVYDAVRTFSGRLFRLEDHVDRLYRSLAAVRIDPVLSKAEMLDISTSAVDRNIDALDWAGDFQVWQYVTRGAGQWAHGVGSPSVCVRVSKIGYARYLDAYSYGVHGVIAKSHSYENTALDPRIKHSNRMHFSLAELEVRDIDPQGWPILTDAAGAITEGTSYNVCIIANNTLKTVPVGRALEGITLGVTMDLAKKLGLDVERCTLYPYDLYNADEVFFTGTSPCLLPVSQVDGRVVGSAHPGPVCERLLQAWEELTGVDIVEQARKFG